MNSRTLSLAAAVVMACGASVAVARGHQGGDEPWVRADVSVERSHGASSSHERDDDADRLPPGLRKRHAALPPGWQKKLARGTVLDATVYREAVRLPEREAVRLGARDGEIVVRIDGKLIRLAEATRTIIDILNER